MSITGVTAYLPPTLVTDQAVEARITGYTPRPGAIGKLSGVRTRHRADPGDQASDLAVHAADKLLHGLGVAPGELDLIVFAAAAQDVVEPATAHIVAAKLGARCPVFDVKNACNSFLNGVQVAEAFIRGGQYRRILVCSGETGSRVARWSVADRAQFADSLAGYTLSDAGAAMVLETSLRPGIFYRDFTADSSSWHVSSIPGSGCAETHDPRRDGYIRGDGRALLESVAGHLRPQLDRALAVTGLSREDFAVFCVHQVATPYLRALQEIADIPEEKLVVTIAEHGNVASCSIPLQLSLALESGRCGPGDKVAFIGLAGGTSIGIVFVEL
ncbi:3-oxoacyl-ACP synthase III family protein [Kutzneria sp. CA-103260]|uniref:3-oxoacyl-ACP synthase III family protein n=1 Tax=Kutzneria sp. CA-103260 TaxID=2802641 RepID=UPI001BEEA48B|nr:ketoacyl-ACP synthase III [Kutzneria sp. CA-103260]QUQ67520.1 3-oxoacyl-ACP synthase [Kutzneria sp. CA-103260]